SKSTAEDGFGWEGTNRDDCGARHLGVFGATMRQKARGEICVRHVRGCRGWGFGHKAFVDDDQGYSWAGKAIPPTVFEIAVKRGELTEAESRMLAAKVIPADASEQKIHILVVSVQGEWTAEEWARVAPRVRALADSPNGGMTVQDSGNTKGVTLWPVSNPK